jgi:hypothetical protein
MSTASNSAQERRDCCAFEQVRAMVRIVEQLQAEFPEAIVDFDITEAGRSAGLAWLSAGKYFLVNNGPYHMNYDIPFDRERENWNMLFYPGPHLDLPRNARLRPLAAECAVPVPLFPRRLRLTSFYAS